MEVQHRRFVSDVTRSSKPGEHVQARWLVNESRLWFASTFRCCFVGGNVLPTVSILRRPNSIESLVRD